LPNKVILPINKTSIIEVIYKRVFSKNYETIVAISNDKTDNLISSILKLKKIPHFRGSLINVKSRFLDLCKNFPNEKIIVRLTADNIFPDKYLINDMIRFFKKNNKQYLYINQQTKKIPYGLSVEVFKLSEIRKKIKKNKKDSEHVTYSLQKKKNDYPIKTGFFFKKKASIDVLEDYFFLNQFFQNDKIDINLKWDILIRKFNEFCITNKKIYPIKNKDMLKIILGTAQFGNLYGISNLKKIKNEDIGKISSFCKFAGIENIDTARDYLNSEKLIGKYFSEHSNLKVYTKITDKIKQIQSQTQITKFLNISIKKSLKFIKKKKIECLYIHNLLPDNKENLIIFQLLKKIKKKYKISKIGVSITNMMDIDKILNSKNKDYVDVLQVPQNILDNRLSKKTIKRLHAYKIEVVYRSIFLQGIIFLTKKNLWPSNLKKYYKIFFKKIKFIKEKLGILSNLELALLYMFSKNKNNKIIIGINSFSNLTEIYSLLHKKKLSDKKIRFIEKEFEPLNKKEVLSNPSLWS